MLASQRAMGTQQVGARTAGAPPTPASAPDLTKLMELMQQAMTGGNPEHTRREIGAFALAAQTAMTEDQWLSTFGFLTGAQWPEKRFIATAIDAEDGSFIAWEKDSSAELGRAVASSCTVPGIFPPVLIKGRRYYDGGIRSATNADLAKGYERVVVVSVTSMAGETEMAQRSRASLDSELRALRAGGSEAELVTPDAASATAFGPNLMDGSRRAAVVEEGYRQGKSEATRLRGFWESQT
jgi:NTE family protein